MSVPASRRACATARTACSSRSGMRRRRRRASPGQGDPEVADRLRRGAERLGRGALLPGEGDRAWDDALRALLAPRAPRSPGAIARRRTRRPARPRGSAQVSPRPCGSLGRRFEHEEPGGEWPHALTAPEPEAEAEFWRAARIEDGALSRPPDDQRRDLHLRSGREPGPDARDARCAAWRRFRLGAADGRQQLPDSTPEVADFVRAALPAAPGGGAGPGALPRAQPRARRGSGRSAALHGRRRAARSRLAARVRPKRRASLPAAEFFAGRILVDWEGEPPRWFRQETAHLFDGVLVGYDLGAETRALAAAEPLPIGASFGLRRVAVRALRLVPRGPRRARPENGRGEESEYLLRARRSGALGVYVGDRASATIPSIGAASSSLASTGTASRVALRTGRSARPSSRGSRARAMLHLLRGAFQLLKGRGDHFRRCVLNCGIEIGMRRSFERDPRMSAPEVSVVLAVRDDAAGLESAARSILAAGRCRSRAHRGRRWVDRRDRPTALARLAAADRRVRAIHGEPEWADRGADARLLGGACGAYSAARRRRRLDARPSPATGRRCFGAEPEATLVSCWTRLPRTGGRGAAGRHGSARRRGAGRARPER